MIAQVSDGVGRTGVTRGGLVVMKMLCLDCVSVNVLVVTLSGSFGRHYPLGKLGDGCLSWVCIISYNYMSMYSFL